MRRDDSTLRLRRWETGLAGFTLGALVVYVPVETWWSRHDLTSPGYVVDAIAMTLLLVAAVHSLRSRPRPSVALLCGAWGWSACLAWRTYFMRVLSRERGLGVYAPGSEWQERPLACVLGIALVAFGVSLVLAWRGGRARGGAA